MPTKTHDKGTRDRTANKRVTTSARTKSARASKAARSSTDRNNNLRQTLFAGAKALGRSTAVEGMLSYAMEMQAEASRYSKKTFEVELLLCRALVSAAGWIAMALYSNEGKSRLYPRDWLEPQGTTNPDLAMGCVLCQVANYGFSVVSLVERGLDTPARAVLRSAADLCYMLALLSNDRQALQLYVLDDSVTEKERWYNLCSNRKLSARLREIDRALGLPTSWTTSMEAFRLHNNEFFSEATHHSPNAILIGSLPPNPKTGYHELSLLGGPNRFSRATLGHLLTVMYYGLTMFLQSTKTFAPKFSRKKFWSSGVDIINTIHPLFLRWLIHREASSPPHGSGLDPQKTPAASPSA